MSRPLAFSSALFCLLLYCCALQARVTRVEVASRADVLDGQPFGSAGVYERLTGRVYFAVTVGNVHDQAIVDLENAVNRQGDTVEFSADFVALRPKDNAKGNGSMLLENPNRGQTHILALVDGGDPTAAKSAGDGWLLRNGFTFASLGWQWDATGAGALHFYAPVAKDHGKTITGLLHGDVMPSHVMYDLPLGHFIIGNIGGSEYKVADADDPRNTLTVRDAPYSPRTTIARARWHFAADHNGIHLDAGFQPGKIYEYVYVVADPVVAGLSFAAVRDFASYMKHDPGAIAPVKRVYGEGISQNGRFLRDFLYQGFNADEQGRMALDGVLAHVAGAGRGSFNARFAQPSRDAQPTSSLDFPTDIFPFTDQPETDPATGKRAGLLDRAAAEHVVPKIFFSNTSYEYWGRAASLIHITADGKQDATLSPDVRVYYFTGLQHFSGPFPPARGTADLLGQQPESPLPVRFFWRAMIGNMDAWVRASTQPPPSTYPKLADGTLVAFDHYSFPELPHISKPHEANRACHFDFGPKAAHGIFTIEPPAMGACFPVFVPKVNSDGNELAGIHLPEEQVPLATYTGWNLRDPSIGAPEQRVSFEGSYIPFARSAAEREASHDPRPSIAERYRSESDYLQQYTAAVDRLIQQRWLLPEDRNALVERGKQDWDLAMAMKTAGATSH